MRLANKFCMVSRDIFDHYMNKSTGFVSCCVSSRTTRRRDVMTSNCSAITVPDEVKRCWGRNDRSRNNTQRFVNNMLRVITNSPANCSDKFRPCSFSMRSEVSLARLQRGTLLFPIQQRKTKHTGLSTPRHSTHIFSPGQ